jgi:Lipase (class 3)
MLKNLACLTPKPDYLYYPPKRGDYVYFDGPPFDTTPGLHYATASWAADAAMFAYARYGQERSTEAEFKGILRNAGFTITETIGDCFVDNAPTARGFFAGNDNFAILAFRGTEKDDPHDIAADLDIVPWPEKALGGRSAGLVHQGFQDYLSSVWATVSKLVSDYRAGHQNQQICITGHSLGAALATLAFHQLQDGHASLYTFGCPRVGNQTFCNDLMLASRTQGLYRIVDNEDVVTHIPDGLGYVHPNCTILWIDPLHNVVQNPPNMPDDRQDLEDMALDFLKGKVVDPLPEPLADHSPVRYCHWIGQRALRKASATTP